MITSEQLGLRIYLIVVWLLPVLVGTYVAGTIVRSYYNNLVEHLEPITVMLGFVPSKYYYAQ